MLSADLGRQSASSPPEPDPPTHTWEGGALMAARQALLLAVLATEIQVAVDVWRHALAVLGH